MTVALHVVLGCVPCYALLLLLPRVALGRAAAMRLCTLAHALRGLNSHEHDCLHVRSYAIKKKDELERVAKANR